MEGNYRPCSESQELIITLRILLEYEEATCTARTNSSYMCGKLQMDATGFGCRSMISYLRRVSNHSPVLWTEWHS